MNVAVESFDVLGRRIVARLPADEFEALVDEEITKQARGFDVRGFRPGRVPRREVVRRIGPEVRRGVLNQWVRALIEQVIHERDWYLLDEPEVDVSYLGPGTDVVVVSELEIFPQLSFASLDGITLKILQFEIDEQFLEEQFASHLEKVSNWEDRDAPAANGDHAHVSFRAFVPDAGGDCLDAGATSTENDDQLPGSEDEHQNGNDQHWTQIQMVLGRPSSNLFVAALDSAIRDCTIGDVRVVDVPGRVPDQLDASADSSGMVQFEVRLDELGRWIPPEVLSQSHYSRLGYGEVSSDEELMAAFREDLEWRWRAAAADRIEKDLFDRLAETIPIPRPLRLVKKRARVVNERVEALYTDNSPEEGNGTESQEEQEIEDESGSSIESDNSSQWSDNPYRSLEHCERTEWQSFLSELIVHEYARQYSIEPKEYMVDRRLHQYIEDDPTLTLKSNIDRLSQIMERLEANLTRSEVLFALLDRIRCELVHVTMTQFLDSEQSLDEWMAAHNGLESAQ